VVDLELILQKKTQQPKLQKSFGFAPPEDEETGHSADG
jgi:hypothetical protein